jgi:hypothetical protein
MGIQCLGVNWAIVLLGDISIGTWLSLLGSLESEVVKYVMSPAAFGSGIDCPDEDQQQL